MSEPTLARDELLRRIDMGWRGLRAGLRHVGRAGMARRTSAGWTYKDLAAHVAAWEQETVRRLRIFRESGGRPGPRAEVDAFNADVVEQHRLVGAEAVLDEIESSHRLLLAELARLDDPPVGDGWVQRVVAGNTFAHYDEHRDELAAVRDAR